MRENDLQKTSFSKYGTEYKKYIAENEEEKNTATTNTVNNLISKLTNW